MIRTKDATKMDNLRFRPFLIIESYYVPSGKVRTERKGWWSDKENVQHKEFPYVVDRINAKLLSKAVAIIDIMNETVIKNSLNAPPKVEHELREVTTKKGVISRMKRKKNVEYAPSKEHDANVVKHYLSKYSDIVEQGKNRWIVREARV